MSALGRKLSIRLGRVTTAHSLELPCLRSVLQRERFRAQATTTPGFIHRLVFQLAKVAWLAAQSYATVTGHFHFKVNVQFPCDRR